MKQLKFCSFYACLTTVIFLPYSLQRIDYLFLSCGGEIVGALNSVVVDSCLPSIPIECGCSWRWSLITRGTTTLLELVQPIALIDYLSLKKAISRFLLFAGRFLKQCNVDETSTFSCDKLFHHCMVVSQIFYCWVTNRQDVDIIVYVDEHCNEALR